MGAGRSKEKEVKKVIKNKGPKSYTYFMELGLGQGEVGLVLTSVQK